jgi:hypothetical protein
MGPDGDIEVDGPGPHMIAGEEKYARSRTFIHATVDNNPYLMATGYIAMLDTSIKDPRERDMLRYGRFEGALQDRAGQLIPTDWIRKAQDRWKSTPPPEVPMCSISLDPAGGGPDNNVIVWRHDGWFSPLIVVPGKEMDDGGELAGLLLKHRKDGAVIVIDMGGGYGRSCYDVLNKNMGPHYIRKFVGAEAATARSPDGVTRLKNKRAQAYVKLRDALDPQQHGGSPIMLPPDTDLLADLAAVTFEEDAQTGAWKLGSKDKIREQLGRSPDRGDAVVMCWYYGEKGLFNLANYGINVKDGLRNLMGRGVNVILGHQEKRRPRR